MKIPKSFDALDWTTEWIEIIKTHPDIPTDEGTMISWFASAIMRGFDEARRREEKRVTELIAQIESAPHAEEALTRVCE